MSHRARSPSATRSIRGPPAPLLRDHPRTYARPYNCARNPSLRSTAWPSSTRTRRCAATPAGLELAASARSFGRRARVSPHSSTCASASSRLDRHSRVRRPGRLRHAVVITRRAASAEPRALRCSCKQLRRRRAITTCSRSRRSDEPVRRRMEVVSPFILNAAAIQERRAALARQRKLPRRRSGRHVSPRERAEVDGGPRRGGGRPVPPTRPSESLAKSCAPHYAWLMGRSVAQAWGLLRHRRSSFQPPSRDGICTGAISPRCGFIAFAPPRGE